VTDGDLDVRLYDELDSLRDEWRVLAERSGNLFATWEWASTWWSHFGRGHDLVDRHVDQRTLRHERTLPRQDRLAR